MKLACYGNPEGSLVSPQRFHELATSNYKELGKFPYCPQCSERLDLYGINNPGISRFDHQNRDPNLDPLDDCIIADRNDRLKGLEPDGWDYERGRKLRNAFFEDENLRLTYGFCLKLTRAGNLPMAKFKSMIQRADNKKIWCYVNIPLWVVPYILLTFENFSQKTTPNQHGYDFHFVFNKPRGSTASALWSNEHTTSLKKVFSNGNIVSTFDNPFPLSEKSLREKAGDTSWINEATLQHIKLLA